MFILGIIQMTLVTPITPVPWVGLGLKGGSDTSIISSGQPTCMEFLTHDNAVIISFLGAHNL